MLAFFILFVELIGAVVVFVWTMAFLGFADEAHKSRKASFLGKCYASLCVLVAFLPMLVIGALGYIYYFTNSWELVPMGWWLPLIVALIGFPLCWVLISLYNASYKNIR